MHHPYPAASRAAMFIAAQDTADVMDVLRRTKAPGLRIAARVWRELAKADPNNGDPLALLPCPFTAVALMDGEPDETLPVLRNLAASIAIDIPASALLLGTEYSVKAGEVDVLVAMLVRRRSDYSLPAFRERWLWGHAPFGRDLPVCGYRQLHADPQSTPGLPPADRFDGAGIVLFRDLQHVTTARSAREIARDATRDEMQFIDHAASMLVMFQTLT